MDAEVYNGIVYPALINPDGGDKCSNRFCIGIRCEDCINFYEMMERTNERIQSNVERILDGNGHEGC